MPHFILDTGIVLGYSRGAGYADYVEKKFRVSQSPNVALVSVVTKGEIYSLASQFGWGEKKRNALDELLRKLPFVDISPEQIVRKYAEIDSYSLGKNPLLPLPKGARSRTMGKNDLWIAATSSVLHATLVTTDSDFDHLHEVFLEVVQIDQKLTGADADNEPRE
jgi:tRNA(fMet)-specific endonuclease VapC